MPLCRGTVEPGKTAGRILFDAVTVQQQLTIQRLRLRLSPLGERKKKDRALSRIIGNARGSFGQRGSGRFRQNLNSSVPNTVRPGAIIAT